MSSCRNGGLVHLLECGRRGAGILIPHPRALFSSLRRIAGRAGGPGEILLGPDPHHRGLACPQTADSRTSRTNPSLSSTIRYDDSARPGCARTRECMPVLPVLVRSVDQCAVTQPQCWNPPGIPAPARYYRCRIANRTRRGSARNGRPDPGVGSSRPPPRQPSGVRVVPREAGGQPSTEITYVRRDPFGRMLRTGDFGCRGTSSGTLTTRSPRSPAACRSPEHTGEPTAQD